MLQDRQTEMPGHQECKCLTFPDLFQHNTQNSFKLDPQSRTTDIETDIHTQADRQTEHTDPENQANVTTTTNKLSSTEDTLLLTDT
jgi:hypothetical protein